jgi:hypothetical protein
MDDATVDALLRAADDGVDCDGLVVEATDGGYSVGIGGERHHCLDESSVRAFAADHPLAVENWHFWQNEVPPGEDRRAFLRWLEGVDERSATEADEADDLHDRLEHLESGIEATWGQLHVSIRLEDGTATRRYALRHVDDVEGHGDEPEEAVDDAELTDYDDPLEARQLSKFDDRDRYRPLKTAPSLQRGWRFPDLMADELVRTVECFYPATIPNWHREREGDLDVDHWRDTAARQTGIYGVVEELPREAVEWVAEACCVDSQCTKRREWQYDDGEALSADGGDGVYPCREPCSLVVAAARKWAILEGESERTYEFDKNGEFAAADNHMMLFSPD